MDSAATCTLFNAQSVRHLHRSQNTHSTLQCLLQLMFVDARSGGSVAEAEVVVDVDSEAVVEFMMER